MKPLFLEAAAGIVVFLMAYTGWLYITLSGGGYFESLSFEPAVPSSADHVSDFAVPVPGVGVSGDEVVILGSSGSGEVDVTVDDDAVYRTVYVSFNGGNWKPFTLPGEATGDGWVLGASGISIPVNAADFGTAPGVDAKIENHVAVFSCTDMGTGWDCRAGMWQLLTFTVHVKADDEESVTAGCGTCPAGYECVGENCQKKTSGSIRLGAGESVALTTGGEKFLIRLVGIDGDGAGARIYINGETLEVDEDGRSSVVKGALRIGITEIKEFTVTEDGFLEFDVKDDYEVLESCPECIPSTGGGGGSGGGGGGGGGGSSCTPDCSCAAGICSTSSCPNGCGGTCAGAIQPDCGARTCGAAPNGCGTASQCGTCTTGFCNATMGSCQQGACTPDCGTLQCGAAPNGCGGTSACGSCTTGTCYDGFCLPSIPSPPQA